MIRLTTNTKSTNSTKGYKTTIADTGARVSSRALLDSDERIKSLEYELNTRSKRLSGLSSAIETDTRDSEAAYQSYLMNPNESTAAYYNSINSRLQKNKADYFSEASSYKNLQNQYSLESENRKRLSDKYRAQNQAADEQMANSNEFVLRNQDAQYQNAVESAYKQYADYLKNNTEDAEAAYAGYLSRPSVSSAEYLHTKVKGLPDDYLPSDTSRKEIGSMYRNQIDNRLSEIDNTANELKSRKQNPQDMRLGVLGGKSVSGNDSQSENLTKLSDEKEALNRKKYGLNQYEKAYTYERDVDNALAKTGKVQNTENYGISLDVPFSYSTQKNFNSKFMNGRKTDPSSEFENMSDTQKRTYNYLLDKAIEAETTLANLAKNYNSATATPEYMRAVNDAQDNVDKTKQAVKDYYSSIKESITASQHQRQQEVVDNSSKAAQVLYGTLGTFGRPIAYAQIAGNALQNGITGEYKPVDLNAGAVGASRLSSYAQEKSLENAGTVGKTIGQAAYSVAENVASMALGEAGALVWLGLSAAGGEAIEALEKGKSSKYATAMGGVSGLIEGATEKLGMDNLFQTAKNVGLPGVKNVVKSLLKQAGAEASEEVISEFAGNIVDGIANGEESEYNQTVRELQRNGATADEAKRQASAQYFLKNPAQAGLAGAIAGVMLGGFGTGVSAARSTAVANDVIRNGNADLLVAEGLKAPAGSTVYEAAQNILLALNNDKAPSKTDIVEVLKNLDDEQYKNYTNAVSFREREAKEEAKRVSESLKTLEDETEEAEEPKPEAEAVAESEGDPLSRIAEITPNRPSPVDLTPEDAARLKAEADAAFRGEPIEQKVEKPAEKAESAKLTGAELKDAQKLIAKAKNFQYGNEARVIANSINPKNVSRAVYKRLQDAVNAFNSRSSTENLRTADVKPVEVRNDTAVQSSSDASTVDSGRSDGLARSYNETLEQEADEMSGLNDDIPDDSYFESDYEQDYEPAEPYIEPDEKPQEVLRKEPKKAEPVSPFENQQKVKSVLKDSSAETVSRVIAEAQSLSESSTEEERANVKANIESIISEESEKRFAEMSKAQQARERKSYKFSEAYQLRRELKSDRLIVPANVKAEFPEWNNFRKSAFGRLTLVNEGTQGGIPIDTVYQELSSAYPQYFSKETVSNPADQLQEILRVAQDVESLNRDSHFAAQEKEYLASENERYISEQADNIIGIYAGTSAANAETTYNTKSVYEPNKTYSRGEVARRVAESGAKNGVSEETILAISGVASDLGVNVEFADINHKTIAGFYNRYTNSIVLSNKISTDAAAWTVFSHELVHSVENTSAYNDLKAFVQNKVKDSGADWSGLIKAMQEAEKGVVSLNSRDAEFEIVANYVAQNLVSNERDLRELAKTHTEAARTLLTGVDDALGKVTTNSHANTQEASELVNVRKILSDALNERKSTPFTSDGKELPKTEGSLFDLDINALIDEAIKKYGALPKGEEVYDPNNPDYKSGTNRLPAAAGVDPKTGELKRTRRFYQTASNAPMLNQTSQDAAKIESMLNTYESKTNHETVKAAQKMRHTFETLDSAFRHFQSWADGGYSAKDARIMVAFGYELMREAQDAKEYGKVYAIMADIATFTTYAGQDLQIVSVLKRLSPDGALIAMKRVGEVVAKQSRPKKAKGNTKTTIDAVDNMGELERLGNELEELYIEYEDKRLTQEEFEAEKKRILKDIDHFSKEIEKLLGQYKETNGAIDTLKGKLGIRKNQYDLLKGSVEENQEKLDTLKTELDDIRQKRSKLLDELRKLNAKIERAEEQIPVLEQQSDAIAHDTANKARKFELLDKNRRELKEKRSKLLDELRKLDAKIERAQTRISILSGQIDAIAHFMSNEKATLEDVKKALGMIRRTKGIMTDFLTYVKDKGGRVDIPQELVDRFKAAKTDAERDAIQEEIEWCIADQLRGSFSEKIRAWRYMAMLFNPTTHEKNTLSNAVQFGMKGGRDALATLAEKMFVKDKQKRSHAVLTFSESDKALKSYATEDYKQIAKLLQAGGSVPTTDGISEKRKIFNSRVLEAIRKFNTNMLEKEDGLFLRLNYVTSYAEAMKARGITADTITDEQAESLRKMAFEEALRATYREFSWLADKLNEFERHGIAGELIVGGVIPFRKTPLNVLKRSAEYSPIGLIEGVVNAVKAKNGGEVTVMKGETRKVTGNDVINSICSGLTGSAMFAVGYALAGGFAYARPDDDEKDRKTLLDRVTGLQDYSIKFRLFGKEFTYTFDWLNQSIPFFMGLYLRESVEKMKEGNGFWGFVNESADVFLKMFEPMFAMTMLDGISDVFKTYERDGSAIGSALLKSVATGYIMQFFPTFFSKIARIIDPYRRSTYSKNSGWIDEAESIVRQMASKIPFVSKLLEPYRTVYGTPEKNAGGNWVGRMFYNLLSPGFIKEVTHDATDEEMKRVYELVGDTAALPREIPTYVTYNGEKYNLNAEQYDRFGKTMGEESYRLIRELFDSEEYKNLPTEDAKAKAIEKATERAYKTAFDEYMESIGMLDIVAERAVQGLLYGDSDSPREPLPEIEQLVNVNGIDEVAIYQSLREFSGGNAADLCDVLRGLDLTDSEKLFLYCLKIADGSFANDSETRAENYKQLLDTIDTVGTDNFLKVRAALYETDENGKRKEMSHGDKAIALANLNLSDAQKIAMFYPYVMTSKNQGTAIAEALKAGIPVNQYLVAYNDYYTVSQMDDASAGEKAQMLERLINTSPEYQGLTKKQKDLLKEDLAYWYQVKATAGAYSKFYDSGVSDAAAAKFADSVNALKPLAGKETVSTAQKISAIVNTSGTSNAEKLSAVKSLVASGDDAEKDTARLNNCLKSMNLSQYAAARTATEGKTDNNEKIKALLNTSLSDEALKAYYCEYVNYSEEGKTLEKLNETLEKSKGNITVRDVLSFKANTAGITGDKDANGKTIADSKKKKICAYIAGLPISSTAKTCLYLYAADYAASNLGKFKTW